MEIESIPVREKVKYIIQVVDGVFNAKKISKKLSVSVQTINKYVYLWARDKDLFELAKQQMVERERKKIKVMLAWENYRSRKNMNN